MKKMLVCLIIALLPLPTFSTEKDATQDNPPCKWQKYVDSYNDVKHYLTDSWQKLSSKASDISADTIAAATDFKDEVTEKANAYFDKQKNSDIQLNEDDSEAKATMAKIAHTDDVDPISGDSA